VTRSWYLGLSPDDVGRYCVLVGDPGRVEIFARRLEGARTLPERRGLRTVTGRYAGSLVTVCAFGMGAPLATIVLEELAALGAEVVLRAGTAMSTGPELPLGSFIVASAGLRGEGTSRSYAPIEYPAVADGVLIARVTEALAERGLPYHVGIVASYDGFYTEMLTFDPTRAPGIASRFEGLRRLGVYAADMETAAVLVVGSLRRIRVGSVCLVSVDGTTRNTLEEAARIHGEEQLVDVALDAVTSCARPTEPV
jgi:Uridine phosphorylase